MKALQTQVKNHQALMFQTHTNAPSFRWLEVVQETDKALQVKSEENGRTTWLPKSGLKHLPKFDSFTVASWFRKSLWADQFKNANTLKTLGLLA